MKTEA